MVREAIEQRRSELLIAGEDRDPFCERKIRGHHRGSPLVAVGDQIEEQLAADPIEGHEAELVDDEDVDPQEPLLEPCELARVPRLTMTVGYDPRFSGGEYGLWVATTPDKAKAVADILRRHGAVEVRHES